MSIETVRLDWVHDRVFLLRDRFGFPVVMAQPMGVNGADLLPLSVIGCAAWDIVDILQKGRQALTGLQVTAESVREDQAPWRFLAIRLRYRFTGRGLSEHHVGRAIALTEATYCPTLLTLRPAVEIRSEWEIHEAAGTEGDAAQPAGPPPDDAPAGEGDVVELVTRFNDALNAGDVDGMMRLMTEDCVFENTYPPPDGARHAGQAAVRAFWEDFLRTSRQPRLDIEEIFALGDRCVMRWTYNWLDADGRPGHIRGVDVYRVRDGRIAEKLSYVKG